jgi:predicted ATPase
LSPPRRLVISRELLQVGVEHAYAVPSLAIGEARQLFVARARAVRPGFDGDGAVSELCDRLDNLPLAIELAAARTRHLAPEQLLERLGDRLDVLRGGRDADPRQQTLRATIQWSYGLLDEGERRLFGRLSVFAGGCTLDAAMAVCEADLDTLGSLVDKSLVRLRGDGRYWMLETIREFAAERLAESGEAVETRRRHAEFFLVLAGSANLCAESEGEQHHHLVLADQDNIRASLDG